MTLDSGVDPDAIPRGTIICLALAAFASAMSLRVNDALLPKLATEFDVSLGTAAQVISVFATAYGLAQLFFGPVGDRFGKYRVIAWVHSFPTRRSSGSEERRVGKSVDVLVAP